MKNLDITTTTSKKSNDIQVDKNSSSISRKRTLETAYTNKFQSLDSSDDCESSDNSSSDSEKKKEMNRVALKKKKKTSSASIVTSQYQEQLKKTEDKFRNNEETAAIQIQGDEKPAFNITRDKCTIKDIQNYIVWLMLRFKVPTPNWVFTKLSPLINKVIVISIQGMSALMHDKISLLSGKENLFYDVFQKNKVELQLPNYNHIFESLLNIKTHKVQKIDNPEKMKKEIEPKSFYLLNEEQLIENGYFGIKDLKEGWIYSNQVQAIVDLLKPTQGNEENEEVDDGASPSQSSTSSDNDNDLLNNLNVNVKEMLAIDCEMCRTEGGELELTRISIVNEKRKVVLNEFVLTERPIIDYLTQYSGITADTLKNVTNRLSDIHEKLHKLIGPDTVLIGHSLENDLKAMKFIHRKIIDTAILFPTGSSGKFPLKYLTKKYLNRIIQNNKQGHDSIEDAKAVMELVQLKIFKGKSFGTKLEFMENIFDKIHKSAEKKSSFIDRIDDIKLYTSQVVSCFNCENDDEVIEKTIKQSSTNSSSDLIFSQLSTLNDHFKNLEPKPFSFYKQDDSTTTTTITTTIETTPILDDPKLSEQQIKEIHAIDGIEINSTVKLIVRNMELQIKKIYDRLETNSMLVLILGPGPQNDIIKFRGDGNKQNDYLLSVETAKEGYAFLALKN